MSNSCNDFLVLEKFDEAPYKHYHRFFYRVTSLIDNGLNNNPQYSTNFSNKCNLRFMYIYIYIYDMHIAMYDLLFPRYVYRVTTVYYNETCVPFY